MTGGVAIYLAGAPLAKGRHRTTKTGHTFTPERTRSFEARLAWAAQEAMGGRPPLEGPLAVDVVIRMPVPVSKPKKWQAAALAGEIRPTKKPDADNFAKMLDACNLIAWVDDSQIVRLVVEKFYSDQPGFLAKVAPINPKTGVFA